jgi:hypothetical protein
MGVRVRPVLAHRDESGLAGGLVVRRTGPARCTLHVRSSVAHCMYERDASKARCIHSLAGLPLISQNGILSGQIGHGILSRRPKIGCLQRDQAFWAGGTPSGLGGTPISPASLSTTVSCFHICSAVFNFVELTIYIFKGIHNTLLFVSHFKGEICHIFVIWRETPCGLNDQLINLFEHFVNAPSVPSYKTFWKFNLNSQNIL